MNTVRAVYDNTIALEPRDIATFEILTPEIVSPVGLTAPGSAPNL